jgi:predicted nucleic acid-binding protein
MDKVVVDTDVVSFGFKGDTRAALYQPHLAGKLAIISFMTYAELKRWALSRNWGKQRLLKLRQHVRSNFIVHPVSGRLCRWWAEVSQRADNNGRPISTADAWHAAVAMRYGIPLVTHNPAHFAGLTIITEAP